MQEEHYWNKMWVQKQAKWTYNVIENKEILVAQRCNQREGIDYTDTFAPVARPKRIRLLLSYAVNHGITLYQMDMIERK